MELKVDILGMPSFEMENSTKVILKVVFAGLVLMFLWIVRDIIVILLMSLILASAMDPLVGYLNKKHIPRAVSVLTVYILILGTFGLVFYLITPPVVEQFKIFKDNIPLYTQGLQNRLGGLIGSNSLNQVMQNLLNGISSNNSLVNSTFGIFNGVFSLVTVLVISFYLTAEDKGMKKFVANLIPQKHHEVILSLLDKIQKKMGMWVLGQIILSLSIFAFTIIGLSLLRVPNALLLAFFAAVMEIFPYVGPFISAIPAVLIAFIYNPPLAIAVAVLYLLIQKTEGYVLVPKIMQKTIGTSPLVVLIALLVGLKLAGIVGLLIAVPLASAIILVIQENPFGETAVKTGD